MLSPDKKEQLLARFSAYLDATPASDSTPDQASRDVDLYSLFTELAALKTEVKIESRQVKSAIEEFQTVTELLRDNNQQLSNELTSRRREEKAEQQSIERPLLLELLELRDRIEAGAAAAAAYPPGLWAWLRGRGKRHVASLQEGMDITLRRLDNLLTRYQVTKIETQNRPLDPYCMQAIETENRPNQEEGIVLSEQRKGYLHQGALLRQAEVVVNKREKS
ncbi:MAG: nucleotide exchange factor GrpE [Candidatus Polarisedimenticolaceae bacterium]|nr:nucleotide exchange factor GrpE [Candidatus Polarisedimenticolaceae bacterium]